MRSAPPSPTPRQVYEAGEQPRYVDMLPVGEEGDKEGGEEEEEIAAAAANASMLLDFVEVMKAGVFVQARSWFASEVRCVIE